MFSLPCGCHSLVTFRILFKLQPDQGNQEVSFKPLLHTPPCPACFPAHAHYRIRPISFSRSCKSSGSSTWKEFKKKKKSSNIRKLPFWKQDCFVVMGSSPKEVGISASEADVCSSDICKCTQRLWWLQIINQKIKKKPSATFSFQFHRCNPTNCNEHPFHWGLN